jgi:dethiobiotin synthetase
VRDVLVTGTDTGVGKTLIAAALIKALRNRGISALGFKPMETGLDADQASDSEVLRISSGETVASAEPVLRLAEALAPAVAAERAGVVVDADEIERRIDELRRAGYTLIVEGAGGVTVPLVWWRNRMSGAYTILDLAARRGLHAVVVGRPGLGTLNHIMLTVAMLRARQVPIAGIVLSGRHDSYADLAESTNPFVLARLLPDARIVEVPHQSASTTAEIIDSAAGHLASFAEELSRQ